MLATAKLVGYPSGATNWSIIFKPTSGGYINPKPSSGGLSDVYIFEFSEEIAGRFVVYFFENWSEFKDYTTYETTLKDGYTYEFGATSLKAEIPPPALLPPPSAAEKSYLGFAPDVNPPPPEVVSWKVIYEYYNPYATLNRLYSLEAPYDTSPSVPINTILTFVPGGEWTDDRNRFRILLWTSTEFYEGVVTPSHLIPNKVYLASYDRWWDPHIIIYEMEESWDVSTPDSEYS